jgi:hypothetical protein
MQNKYWTEEEEPTWFDVIKFIAFFVAFSTFFIGIAAVIILM